MYVTEFIKFYKLELLTKINRIFDQVNIARSYDAVGIFDPFKENFSMTSFFPS